MAAEPLLLQRGAPQWLTSTVCGCGYFLPAGTLSAALLRHAGLRNTSALLVAVGWLLVLAQLVDWAYRHLFHRLLEHSLLGGVVAVGLAVAVPPLLNGLNGTILSAQWARLEPPVPVERQRPLYIFAFLTVARGQREMLAAVYHSPAGGARLALPAVLVMAAGRFYASKAAASLVDKKLLSIPAAATKGIASGACPSVAPRTLAEPGAEVLVLAGRLRGAVGRRRGGRRASCQRGLLCSAPPHLGQCLSRLRRVPPAAAVVRVRRVCNRER